ncbi:BPL-N domain-containing protein [Desulfonatronospira sp.]|uniref:BPL-N domain-containing protein n=1 Tax=Desulfonatronospira sp. TaxID=1962951 RepID=UPI0025BC530F|nr:BPL-N domain-containing protein [Desulfonatronospira sp.]
MHTSENKIYMLWDESHLWGLMLWRALQALEIPRRIVRAHTLRQGLLSTHPPAALLVPGGWARLKADSLGLEGMTGIRDYIRSGGRYLGICGGAGLGLSSASGTPCLDLCTWSRKPIQERLPNFSGHVRCRVRLPHWSKSRNDIFLPVWWPSQFEQGPKSTGDVDTLAQYLEPGRDFWTADLPYSDLDHPDVYRWEQVYGINLDPERLRSEPCMLHGRLGRGEFVLSYSHLETPQSPQANRLLRELLLAWLGYDITESQQNSVTQWDICNIEAAWDDGTLQKCRAGLHEAIELGRSHFLFYWRTPWLLGWRRGVPGSPLNFLYAMTGHALEKRPDVQALRFWEGEKKVFEEYLDQFISRLKTYLIRERLALSLAPSSPEASSDRKLQQEKKELFGSFPGYGGLYGRLIRPLDHLLYLLER